MMSDDLVKRGRDVVLDATGKSFEYSIPVVIIGAGACGCTAALSAHNEGVEVLVLERDAMPRGNTALSGGQIPAGGTQLQREAAIDDAPDILAADLIAKAKSQCDVELAHQIAKEAAGTVDWLVSRHGLPLSCISNFVYPGHSRPHMHATPGRYGAELLDGLLAAVQAAGIDLLCSAQATHLFAQSDGRIAGVRVSRPDGTIEDIGCDALILACNGYGANTGLLREFIPDMADAAYLGHAGNQGDALLWGAGLGASAMDLGAFQGHGAVCTPHMVQIGWPVFTEGGFQVNASGQRFSNENAGYSEQARKVLAQPDGIAFAIWDERCDAVARQMHSHGIAAELGAIKTCATVTELAGFIGCQDSVLGQTLLEVETMSRGEAVCPWGRDFAEKEPLAPPYLCARITGALFHTQGGLEVDADGCVLDKCGQPLPNLFAGGGAARGLSGPADWGYLSGSGLMMAVNLGRLSGRAAARLVAGSLKK